jgi:hypothetical protein
MTRKPNPDLGTDPEIESWPEQVASAQAKPIVAKLRSAGVDSFRYLIDQPLVLWEAIGSETVS